MYPVTERAYRELMLDMPLSPSVRVDFGVDTVEHHRALQSAVKKGLPIEDLDKALGNGKALTEIAKRYGYNNVCFLTAYDEMEEEDEGFEIDNRNFD